MKLSIENLRQGMKWWQEGKWPKDYLNHDYYSIYEDRAGGLTEQWLNLTIERLVHWKALRSSRPGNTKAKFYGLLEAKLPSIRSEYYRVVNLSEGEPSIRSIHWEDIANLYEMMAEIKNGSTVFASKLGHFVFPKMFIVMDNLGTRVTSYERYWPGIVNEWESFADKNLALDLLKTDIEKHSKDPLHPLYPYETKIMELCLIGEKWRRKREREPARKDGFSSKEFLPPKFLRGIEKSPIRQITDRAKPGDISLGLGEPDLPTPDVIRRAAVRVITEEQNGYTLQAGLPALRELVASDYPQLGLSAEEVIITAGSQEAMYLALMTLIEPGDEVLMPDPGFVAYPVITQIAGGKSIYYRLPAKDDFGFNLKAFKQRVTEKTKVLICISPSNPTGRAFSAEELRSMAQALEKKGGRAFVISDEIYRELYYTPERPPSISEFYPRTVVISGLSKSMSMTGWRLGWMCGDKDVIKSALLLHGYVTTCASSISQKAALSSWSEEGEAARANARKILGVRREHLLGLFARELDLKAVTPDGAFYTMVDIHDYGSSLEVAETFLGAGVVTVPGNAFGSESEGFLRVSFCADLPVLTEGVERMKPALKRLEK